MKRAATEIGYEVLASSGGQSPPKESRGAAVGETEPHTLPGAGYPATSSLPYNKKVA